MIRVHHLEQSRSFRVLWLLEELGIDYQLVEYCRDPVTRLAPLELERVNALGKSPVVEDGDLTLFESGAIIDYLIRRHGAGRFAPDPATAAYDRYQMWLHYTEGSAMLPVMLNVYVTTRGGETPELRERLNDELIRHRNFVAAALLEHDYLIGDEITGADVNMAITARLLDIAAPGEPTPTIQNWLGRLEARPAYARAIERGGEVTFQARTTA